LCFARASRLGSARAVLADGPPEWNAKDVANSRYFITDLVNDIRSPRSGSEFIGTATRLHPMVATHFFRSQRLWSAKGKSTPVALGRSTLTLRTNFPARFRLRLRTALSSQLFDCASAFWRRRAGGFSLATDSMRQKAANEHVNFERPLLAVLRPSR
jgi:hypothetical protein